MSDTLQGRMLAPDAKGGSTTSPKGRSDKVGTVIVGKYRVDRVLGEGTTGIVLCATHLDLDEHVAIKLLHPQAASMPGVIPRFLNEGRAVAKIRSPHIVRVRDVGRLEDGTPYTVMELLDGENLATMIEQRRRLPIVFAVDLTLQACDALAEAHDAGIIHRDVKPENLIVVQQRGQACLKVVDFGISKMTDGSQGTLATPTHEILGSPVYMSPEQLESSRSVDGRADIWSLGNALFEMLAGKAPFERGTLLEVHEAVMTHSPPDLRSLRPEVPAALAEAINRCLVKDREGRWPTMRAFAEAIAPWASPLGLTALNASRGLPPLPSLPPPAPSLPPPSANVAAPVIRIPPPARLPMPSTPTLTADTLSDPTHETVIVNRDVGRSQTWFQRAGGRKGWLHIAFAAVGFAFLGGAIVAAVIGARARRPTVTTIPEAVAERAASANFASAEPPTQLVAAPPPTVTAAPSPETPSQPTAPVQAVAPPQSPSQPAAAPEPAPPAPMLPAASAATAAAPAARPRAAVTPHAATPAPAPSGKPRVLPSDRK